MNRAQLLRAELALAHNDYDCALEQITEATPLARAHNMPKNVAKCLLYQGEALLGLGRSEEAVLRLQEAMAMADQIVHGSLRWKIRLRLAQAHTVLGWPTTELYRQALAQIDTIVDALHDQHMRASFLGAPLVIELKANARSALKPLPDAPSPPADLSDREVEVLQLVAQGYTDRQIGAELHVSARTVNAHVTNILNKTACPNRTAAATFAVRHGLL